MYIKAEHIKDKLLGLGSTKDAIIAHFLGFGPHTHDTDLLELAAALTYKLDENLADIAECLFAIRDGLPGRGANVAIGRWAKTGAKR